MNAADTISIGLSLTPETASYTDLVAHARQADELGLDFIGIQDHPYQRRYLDTMALIGVLLAQTQRITIFPDVANLPLRPPAMLAKTAATLDVISGGRFELGIGAGAFWDAVVAFGGPRRTPGESLEALAEAIALIRQLWSGERSVTVSGEHYSARGAHFGPLPAHDIGIWVGAYKPRMLRLVGRLADGWVPSFGRVGRAELRDGHARIDEAAANAGRDPRAIRRILNVSGTITAPGGGDMSAAAGSSSLSDGPAAPAEYWTDLFGQLRDDGFDGLVFWPVGEIPEQVERLATEVAPALRGAATG